MRWNPATGGFLSVGKLTARLEKKAEGGRRKAEKSNPQSPIPNPSLSTSHVHYSLFALPPPPSPTWARSLALK